MATHDLYSACSLCPRNCRINRNRGKTGFCGETSALRIAYAGLHYGEEPPITGSGGSGTVFFTGCTLQCFFCQNYQLSREKKGFAISPAELAAIFLKLQSKGAANINLVSGTHFTPDIITATALARQQGLVIPLVWNSAGFDTTATLELLLPWVDIYLPDLKTLDPELADRIFRLPTYPDYARAGLEFLRDSITTQYRGGLLLSGILVRHLVLPAELESTYQALSWYRANLAEKALLSLMFQYTPPPGLAAVSGINRRWLRTVTDKEYAAVCSYLAELGIEEGFIQEPDNREQTWSPDFAKENPFRSAFSKPVWTRGAFADLD